MLYFDIISEFHINFSTKVLQKIKDNKVERKIIRSSLWKDNSNFITYLILSIKDKVTR